MSEKETDLRHAVILTAIPVEYQAVRAHLSHIREELHPLGTIYERGTFLSTGESWDVVIGEIGAGNPTAALEAERAINHFRPAVILLVGVAGGRKDVELGDVVAATKVYGYESGKSETVFLPRPSIGSSTYRMEQRARAEARKPDWLQRRKGALSTRTPNVYIAPIAAGEKVVASTRSHLAQFLQAEYGDALAVEMEGYGFLQATRANPQVEALVIRGISDLLDGKQEADAANFQELAAQHASAFAFEILSKFDEMPSIHPRLLRFPAAFPDIWNVPHRYKPFFTGRDHILSYVHEALFTLDDTADLGHPVALNGPGGIGKTQTAAVYAYKYRTHYRTVLWVKADTRDALISDLRKFADLLHLSGEKLPDDSHLIVTVMEWFRNHSDWLLILDNADDILMAEAFIPKAARGHILLTTRAQATGGFAEHIELEKLSPEDGALFILRRSNMIGPHERPGDTTEAKYIAAQDISRLVDGLPLALEQAGAYIEETACGISRYLRLYRARSDEMRRLRSGPVPDYPEAVATTWDVSMQAVQAINPAAAELLQFFAFLSPDAIPEEIITKGAPHLGPILQPVAADPMRLNTAVKELLKYSLIRRDTDRNTDTSLFTIHHLVQDVQKDAMDSTSQRQWAERVVRAVSLTFLHVTSNDWQLHQALLPHVRTCAKLIKQWKMTFIEADQLLQKMASWMPEI